MNLGDIIKGAVIVAAIATGVGAIGAAAGMSAFAGFSAAATFTTTFFTTAAMSVVSNALADKPNFNSLQRGATITQRDPVSSRKLIYGQRRIGGTIVFMDTVDVEDGAENGNLEMAIALATHECESIEKIYFNETLAFTPSSGDPEVFDYDAESPYTSEYAAIEARLGASGQSAFSSPLVTSSKWTSDHKLEGVCSLYARLSFDTQVGSNGMPNITAEVKGRKIYDPRSDQTVYSNNAALVIRDYLLDSEFGLGAEAAEIDETSFSDAADVCDEQVSLDAGGTESRYTINGIIDTAVTPRENIEQMLTAMAGKLVYSGGKFKLYAGEYRTPSVTIDEDDLIGAITVKTKNSQRDNFNRVKGTFVSPTDLYQPVEYPAVESSTYQTIDGLTSTFTYDLPFTTSSATAQRLAKLQLNKTRQEITVTLPCKLTALNVAPGDFISVNNTRLGFTNKTFEVVSCDLNANDQLGINIVAQEVSQATYDWQATDEQAIINNNTPATTQFTVAPPTNLSATSTASVAPDGTTIAAITASWDASVHRSVIEYEVSYRYGSNDYTYMFTSDTDVEITGLESGQQYTVRVRSITATGAFSDYDSTTVVAAGDTTAPATPSGLSADGVSRAIVLDWTANTEADIRHYLVYEGSSAQFSNATLIATVLTDNFTRNALPDSSTRYYWVRAVDYSGNQSGVAGPVSATTDAAIAAEDTKAANGYVYYQISTGSQPSTPSASSYNFNTGAFSGLSSSWSIQPPEVDGTDAEYWASSWNVLEDTGGQTITFSTPFRSFQFDGLVTFTNLNNELADPNSTEITTISGGLIKTGTVDANRIELDGNTIEAGASGIRIKNLGVDTLQIADNAVTVPDAVFTTSPISITTSGPQYLVVQSLAVSSIGGVPNLITFSCHAFSNTKEQFVAGLAVNRNGSTTFLLEVGSYSVNSANEILPNTTISGSVVHTPSTTGTDVYQVFLYHAQSGRILRANARSISRLTVKK